MVGPQTSISMLALSPTVISKLIEADFNYIGDIGTMKPSELSAASKLTLKESSEVIRLCSSGVKCQAKNVIEMLEEKEDTDHIVTFCQAIDQLLGGGIPIGAITEISGTPGVGKTQMCMQMCVSARVPNSLGGVEGGSIFVDTEGSFTISRLKEIASHAESHLRSISKEVTDAGYDTTTILKGIYYFRCHSHLELVAVIKHMPTFLSKHPNIRLLVIDSMAFHFRHGFTDMAARTSLLCSLTQDLIQQATEHKMAVIVTNQMTMRMESVGSSKLVPALGEAWGHCPTLRLYLHWTGGNRTASLMKAPHMAQTTAQFWITAGGIRDVSARMEQHRKRKRSTDSHQEEES